MALNSNEDFQKEFLAGLEYDEPAPETPSIPEPVEVVPEIVNTPVTEAVSTPVETPAEVEVDDDDRFTIIDSAPDGTLSIATKAAAAPVVPVQEIQVPAKSPEPAKIEFANKDSEYLFELLKQGKLDEVKDMLNASLADYSKLAPIDKVREELKRTMDGVDDQTINEYIKDKYHLYTENDEDFDEKEARKGRIALQMDASKAQAFLESTKKPLSIPDNFKNTGGTDNSEEVIASYLKGQEANMVEEQVKAQAQWQQTVDGTLADIPKMKFRLNDNTEVEYALTDTEKRQLKTDLRNANIPNIFEQLGWMENGKENLIKIAHDMYLIKNKDKVVRAASKQQAISEKLNLVRNMNNVDLNKTAPTGTASTQAQDDSDFEDRFLSNKR